MDCRVSSPSHCRLSGTQRTTHARGLLSPSRGTKAALTDAGTPPPLSPARCLSASSPPSSLPGAPPPRFPPLLPDVAPPRQPPLSPAAPRLRHGSSPRRPAHFVPAPPPVLPPAAPAPLSSCVQRPAPSSHVQAVRAPSSASDRPRPQPRRPTGGAVRVPLFKRQPDDALCLSSRRRSPCVPWLSLTGVASPPRQGQEEEEERAGAQRRGRRIHRRPPVLLRLAGLPSAPGRLSLSPAPPPPVRAPAAARPAWDSSASGHGDNDGSASSCGDVDDTVSSPTTTAASPRAVTTMAARPVQRRPRRRVWRGGDILRVNRLHGGIPVPRRSLAARRRKRFVWCGCWSMSNCSCWLPFALGSYFTSQRRLCGEAKVRRQCNWIAQPYAAVVPLYDPSRHHLPVQLYRRHDISVYPICNCENLTSTKGPFGRAPSDSDSLLEVIF
ncbi:hypothetical protein BS78_01G043200 [Paspalum vaginatum]|nr:hypothetical protein BS78_01G043200 [Paspalum vaginatum]KAJ1293111.1 hypothetical protein BS78_01G043200 [Paspalum vaginatum]